MFCCAANFLHVRHLLSVRSRFHRFLYMYDAGATAFPADPIVRIFAFTKYRVSQKLVDNFEQLYLSKKTVLNIFKPHRKPHRTAPQTTEISQKVRVPPYHNFLGHLRRSLTHRKKYCKKKIFKPQPSSRYTKFCIDLPIRNL